MSEVVVTGMGIVSPLGIGVAQNWNNLTFPDRHPRQPLAGDPKNGNAWVPRQRPRGMTDVNGFHRARELSLLAATEALTSAGLWDGQALAGIDPERLGCTVSASKPFFAGERGVRLLPPDVINSFVADRFALQGERRNVIAACATGAYSIALGASWIEQGLCDAVIAGSVEPYPHPLIEAGFRRMGVLSAEGVTRPFDRHRSGFAFGEGAGIVVLESAASAHRRRAESHGRLTGWALGSDTHSPVAFNSNGAKISTVIGRALQRARLRPTAIQHINAHGTATRLNDWIETQALVSAFGTHAGRLMISATKASTGHLLGASGSVEFILTILALAHQFVPPTATLETQDPECALDYTPKVGRRAALEHAMSLSFGFGGPIGALVVSL